MLPGFGNNPVASMAPVLWFTWRPAKAYFPWCGKTVPSASTSSNGGVGSVGLYCFESLRYSCSLTANVTLTGSTVETVVTGFGEDGPTKLPLSGWGLPARPSIG